MKREAVAFAAGFVTACVIAWRNGLTVLPWRPTDPWARIGEPLGHAVPEESEADSVKVTFPCPYPAEALHYESTADNGTVTRTPRSTAGAHAFGSAMREEAEAARQASEAHATLTSITGGTLGPATFGPEDAPCAHCGHASHRHDGGIRRCRAAAAGDCTCERFIPRMGGAVQAAREHAEAVYQQRARRRNG